MKSLARYLLTVAALLPWSLSAATPLNFSGDYAFLAPFVADIPLLGPEKDESFPSEDAPLAIDMTQYYEEFAADGVIKIYYGLGIDAYEGTVASTIKQMLEAGNTSQNLGLVDFVITGNNLLTFRDPVRDIEYHITFGHERNEFRDAFANNEIVMYLGHSRYGRGPAFDDYTNYFRMGDVFDTIEVDTRNAYFQAEPLRRTNEFPPLNVTLGTREYVYQYRGQKVESSHLETDAYTKVIPGGAVDLVNTRFARGRQILFLNSCSNENYWKRPLRQMWRSADKKLVFGTKLETYKNWAVEVAFLTNFIQQMSMSDQIVEKLNTICTGCYTAY